jgi:hypothetical protein
MRQNQTPSMDEQVDRQVRQSYYVAASRHLSQIAGILLLLLHDRHQQRVERHLPALAASADRLKEYLAANPMTMDRIPLTDIQERLALLRRWIASLPLHGPFAATEIAAALDELQRLRDQLLAAGKRSCLFGMVQFAAGCCCGQHSDGPTPLEAGR